MATENAWRARKIQAELTKLGIRVSLATISRYLPKKEGDPTRQLRETFPNEPEHRYLIYDNDAIFSPAVTSAIKSFGVDPKRTAFRSPWQNGTAERVHTSIIDSPVGRPAESRPSAGAKVIGLPRVGDLHHRYTWREAA
jgi:hypothetical protein